MTLSAATQRFTQQRSLLLATGLGLCIVALWIAARASGADAVPEQWQRGQALFQANCSNGCHMPNLHAGAVAPALSGKTFLQHWQGLGANELFDRIRSTMPQPKPRSLSDQTYVDILAFILHENEVPLPAPQLQSDADSLSALIMKPAN
jgi:S-disulfanyl-L-cysteine oxidoreductase SoxD